MALGDAAYLDERVLQPLQRAIALVRETDKVEAILKQRVEQVAALERDISTLTQQKQQILDGMTAARKQAAEVRKELQEQIQDDRKKREQERADWDREREEWRAFKQAERDELAVIAKRREQAERELEAIKQDISGRLELLQKVGS